MDAATGRYPLAKIADLPHLNDVFTQFVRSVGRGRFMVSEANSSGDASGGAVFHYDVADRDSSRQSTAMDRIR